MSLWHTVITISKFTGYLSIKDNYIFSEHKTVLIWGHTRSKDQRTDGSELVRDFKKIVSPLWSEILKFLLVRSSPVRKFIFCWSWSGLDPELDPEPVSVGGSLTKSKIIFFWKTRHCSGPLFGGIIQKKGQFYINILEALFSHYWYWFGIYPEIHLNVLDQRSLKQLMYVLEFERTSNGTSAN